MQTANSWTREDESNNFLYNAGSELNPASGWYETFFRGYDPALGRFHQVDPLAVMSTGMTPYNFAFNNPMMFNDPDGDYPEEVKAEMERHARYLAESGGAGAFNMGKASRYSGNYGPGSGHFRSDGAAYSDWDPNSGSETYRAGLAAGMTDIGGKLYHIGSGGARSPWGQQNGEYGYTEPYVTGTGYHDITVGVRFVKVAQQEKREFPSFSTLWGHYPHSTQNPDGSWNHAHPSVDNYANQCAIRVSFTLMTIRRGFRYLPGNKQDD